MTTLITGAGLIGRLTAEILRDKGERVVLADVRPAVAAAGIHSVVCDVTDRVALEALLAAHGVTRIVHTAAMLSTGIRQDPARGVAVNVMGTANVLELARLHGVKRVVCASSTTVGYSAFSGLPADPVPENFALRFLEHRPASIYAMTKVASEYLGLLYADLYGVDVVVLRYGAVLGGREPPTSVPGRLLATLVAAAKSGTELVLDDPFLIWGGREEFVDARDCARANVAALEAADPSQRAYNVAPGTWHTLAEFVAAVRAVHPGLRVKLPAEPATGFAGFPHRRPAPSATEAAARELGFTCSYDLAATIRDWTSAP